MILPDLPAGPFFIPQIAYLQTNRNPAPGPAPFTVISLYVSVSPPPILSSTYPLSRQFLPAPFSSPHPFRPFREWWSSCNGARVLFYRRTLCHSFFVTWEVPFSPSFCLFLFLSPRSFLSRGKDVPPPSPSALFKPGIVSLSHSFFPVSLSIPLPPKFSPSLYPWRTWIVVLFFGPFALQRSPSPPPCYVFVSASLILQCNHCFFLRCSLSKTHRNALIFLFPPLFRERVVTSPPVFPDRYRERVPVLSHSVEAALLIPRVFSFSIPASPSPFPGGVPKHDVLIAY